MPLGANAVGSFPGAIEAGFVVGASVHGISLMQCRPYGGHALSD